MVNRFSSVDEMMDEFEKERLEERRRNPIKYYAELFWYRVICKLWEMPGYWYREIKWFWQRGTRGWSDRDVWSIDWFLAEIMPPMLQQLKETKHGIPNEPLQEAYEEITGKTDDYTYENDELDNKVFNLAETKFNDILDHIKWTFEIAHRIHEHDFMLWHEGCKDGKHIKYLSKEDTDKFYKGFDLFKEYFFDLWD